METVEIREAINFYKSMFPILMEEAEKKFPGIGEKAIFPAMEEYMYKLFTLTISTNPSADIVNQMYSHYCKLKHMIEQERPDLRKRSKRTF